MLTLQLLAIEGEHSYSPPHTRIGRVVPIGYVRKPDGSLERTDTPVSVTLAGDYATADAAFLRKEILARRLEPANAESAAALGIVFHQHNQSPSMGKEKLWHFR